MADVILSLYDDAEIVTQTRESFASDAEAAARAHDLSHRMTALGVRHAILCRDAVNRLVPYRDARGRLHGAPEDDPESLSNYLSATLVSCDAPTPFTLDPP